MSAAKFLSRAQAERAAAAATRNVNAYGQQEVGPSRMQLKREAKINLYRFTTERPPTVNDINKVKQSFKCQKCHQIGHWPGECKNEKVYLPHPSSNQLVKSPELRQGMVASYSGDFPDTRREEKEDKNEKQGKKTKRKHRSVYSSDESDCRYSSSLDSEDDKRRGKRTSHRNKHKRRCRNYRSSSESSDYYSDSDSVSQRKKHKSRRKRYSSSSESSDYHSVSDSVSRNRTKSKKRSHRR